MTAIDKLGSTSKDWEARQKHAAFFQLLLNSLQQAAIASNATGAVVLTVGVGVAKLSDVRSGEDWAVIYVAVVAWLLLGATLTISFAKSALRLRSDYLAEHGELFPGVVPYRLESFLLDFADSNAFLCRDRRKVERSIDALSSDVTVPPDRSQPQSYRLEDKASVGEIGVAEDVAGSQPRR